MATTWARVADLPRSVVSTQTANESAPTLATDGCNLADVAGFTLYIVCDAGQTFSSAASLFASYRYDAATGLWARADSDVTVGATNVGQRSLAVSFSVGSPRGRIAHVASNVTLSGGGLTLYYMCSMLSGVES